MSVAKARVGDLEIRPYRAGDGAAVAALWRAVFPESSTWNVPEHDIARKRRVQPELFLVAALGGRLVGTVLGGYDGHRGWVHLLAVAPEHRRRGIGAALMAGVEQRLEGLGCPKINLQVRAGNEAVHAFYRRLGYAVEERVSMGKRLGEAHTLPRERAQEDH